MNTIVVNGGEIKSRDDLFAALGKFIVLPTPCGKNLDALSDVLSEAAPVRLELRESAAFRRNLGEWGERCVAALKDMAARNPGIVFVTDADGRAS